MMEALFGLVVWILANLVYADMRRRDQTGFKRLVAFWLGWPGTFVGMLVVSRRSLPPVRDDDDGIRGLVEQIRRDREVRLQDQRGRTALASETSGESGAAQPGGRGREVNRPDEGRGAPQSAGPDDSREA